MDTPQLQHVWAGLVANPTSGVAVVTREGRILFVNERSALVFFGPDVAAGDITGQCMSDLFPEPWVQERLELFERIIDNQEPVMLRTIWRGRQIHSWMYPVSDENNDTPRVLVLTHHVTHLADDTFEPVSVVNSSVMELGHLNVLTPRELEVLALLGQGLSLKQIAELLHRSPKTIENHRNAIGQKLRINDRVRLAELALAAGLRQEDAERERVAPSKAPES